MKCFSLHLNLLLLCLCLVSLSCVRKDSSSSSFSFFSEPGRHLKEAQRLRADGKKKEAITEYEAHLRERLQSRHRLPSENPYFYKTLIGDLYLELENPEAAQRTYDEARTNNVEPELLIERYCRLAAFYTERRNFEKALALLRSYRVLDPIVFDAEIDKTHRALVKAEDESRDQQRKYR